MCGFSIMLILKGRLSIETKLLQFILTLYLHV